MRTLPRRVALGLAGRGEVRDAVEWSRLARDAGLDSVWVHDTPFERDGVTYATAIASALREDTEGYRRLGDETADQFRVALGAVNPYTRHTLVLAMTGSALDEILPERIVMAIGTGNPLRLKQMGIPYSLDEAVRRLETTFDELRELWAGRRLPSQTPGLPSIEPMFPPTHRIPLYLAGYRKELVSLAGRKADGYFGRPCESIPSLRGILERLRESAIEADRNPDEIDTAAFLLSLVDKTRREALNRAKREPFVIYMMTILGDVSLHRAGFETELRDRIGAAWRAEDYHQAGKLIPDELLDAFMLCGTREDVAAKAMAFHVQTGLALPVLQPVVQEERHVRELIEVARLYARLPESAGAPAAERAPAPDRQAEPEAWREAGRDIAPDWPAGATAVASASSPESSARGLADDRRLHPLERVRRRLAAAYEIVRPFAYTVTVVPVVVGGSLAAVDGRFAWPAFLAALFAAMLVQSGTNVLNEVYDVRRGIDTIVSPRASKAVLKGRFTELGAYRFGLALFAAGIVLGLYLVVLRGPVMILLGVAGLLIGYGYTAPPFQFKYKALGVPLIFVAMGPFLLAGTYFAVTGTWDARSLVLSAPVGFLVAAIVHGNDWRDISDDTRAGISTLSSRLGRYWAHYAYLTLVLAAYASLGISIALRALPAATGLVLLSLPFLAQVVGSAQLGAQGQARAIARIDLETAHLHLAFGTLLGAGLLLSQMSLP